VKKVKGLQGCGPKGSPGVKARKSLGVTSHTPEDVRSAREYEGVNPHTPKAISHFGRWNPNGPSKLQRVISRVKIQWLVAFFISLENSWNVDV